MWVARAPDPLITPAMPPSPAASHPVWVARVPYSLGLRGGNSASSRTPCGWRECPIDTLGAKASLIVVAPHVGGASARPRYYSCCISQPRRTPCGWRECPTIVRKVYLYLLGRTPCGWRECPISIIPPISYPEEVAPHVGGASARKKLQRKINC